MKAIVVSQPGSVFHLGLMRGEEETSCYPSLYLWTGKGFFILPLWLAKQTE